MEYFVTIDGRREGPFSTLQLRQRLRQGDIAPDSKVWRRGMGEWQPLRQVDDLAAFVTEVEADYAAGRLPAGSETEPKQAKKPAKTDLGRRDSGAPPGRPAAPAQGLAEDSQPQELEKSRRLSPRQLSTDAGEQKAGTNSTKTSPPPLPDDVNANLPREARAVLRFMARLVDFAIVSMAIGGYMALTVDEPMEWVQQPENARTLTFLLPICAIAYEMILVALFGSTVGKMFFGMRLMDAAGGLLAPRQAAIRAFGVWAVGMGFGISFLLLILPLFWWFRFRSAGVVPWDSWSGLVVVHRPPSRVRLILGLIVVMLVFWQLLVALAMLIGGAGG